MIKLCLHIYHHGIFQHLFPSCHRKAYRSMRIRSGIYILGIKNDNVFLSAKISTLCYIPHSKDDPASSNHVDNGVKL